MSRISRAPWGDPQLLVRWGAALLAAASACVSDVVVAVMEVVVQPDATAAGTI